MDENELRIAKMKEMIEKTERKLKNCFMDNAMQPLSGILQNFLFVLKELKNS